MGYHDHLIIDGQSAVTVFVCFNISDFQNWPEQCSSRCRLIDSCHTSSNMQLHIQTAA